MAEIEIEDLIGVVEMFAVSGAKILPDTLLLKEELIDSLNVVQIISQVESLYALEIGAMDLSFDDFESPNKLLDALSKL
jgi:acyl carrier protein